jgi:CubicO group peptidase (beta-lactamase class C family)
VIAAPGGTALTPAAIDTFLDDALESTGLPGLSVVVTHGSDVLHAAGYGHDSDGNPITAHTPMRIASLSNAFAAMAVMTLVDDGRIMLMSRSPRSCRSFAWPTSAPIESRCGSC